MGCGLAVCLCSFMYFDLSPYLLLFCILFSLEFMRVCVCVCACAGTTLFNSLQVNYKFYYRKKEVCFPLFLMTSFKQALLALSSSFQGLSPGHQHLPFKEHLRWNIFDHQKLSHGALSDLTSKDSRENKIIINTFRHFLHLCPIGEFYKNSQASTIQ